MSISFVDLLDQYWSAQKWEVNLLITCNLLGGLLLGCLVGYERWSNGRAAGMRTYGLVSMASAGSSAWWAIPVSGMAAFTPTSCMAT
jgi:putative Mg2+ transporter-C (MgtC) family protein